MNLDLNTLLEGWPHEPGQIRVRRIRGIDGREKVQLRLDLGLIQMELEGRPDGVRPKGAETLLDWHRERALAAETDGQRYSLDGDECGELHQEGVQYYHRYLALFQLEDFKGVVRDTQHNLDLFAFISKHADREEIASSFEQFQPYVLMMNTRAKASLELDKGNVAGAIDLIEHSRDDILKMLQQRPEPQETSAEVQFLGEWLEELRTKRPLSKLELMQREMAQAVAAEAYERAAELRDAIRAFTQKAATVSPEAPKSPAKHAAPKAATQKAPRKPAAKRPAKAPKATAPKVEKPAKRPRRKKSAPEE